MLKTEFDCEHFPNMSTARSAQCFRLVLICCLATKGVVMNTSYVRLSSAAENTRRVHECWSRCQNVLNIYDQMFLREAFICVSFMCFCTRPSQNTFNQVSKRCHANRRVGFSACVWCCPPAAGVGVWLRQRGVRVARQRGDSGTKEGGLSARQAPVEWDVWLHLLRHQPAGPRRLQRTHTQVLSFILSCLMSQLKTLRMFSLLLLFAVFLLTGKARVVPTGPYLADWPSTMRQFCLRRSLWTGLKWSRPPWRKLERL